MIVRRFAAGATVALAAVAGLPAVAHAAPVNPAQAVLTAAEFPFGNTGYKVSSEVGQQAGKPDGDSACDRAAHAVDKAVAGARSTDATAQLGSSSLEASVIERPMARPMREAFRSCAGQLRFEDGVTLLPLPADLSRYTGFVARSSRARVILAVVDVRGSAIAVEVDGKGGATADEAAFWQMLRAQVSKVERQP